MGGSPHHAQPRQDAPQDAADEKGCAEHEGGHQVGHLPAALLHHHEVLGDARDEQRDRHEAHHGLHPVELAGSLERKQSRRAEVPAEEPHEERPGRLRRQPQPRDDERRGETLQHKERAHRIQHKQHQRPQKKQRHGFFHVPLHATQRLDEHVGQLRPTKRRERAQATTFPSPAHSPPPPSPPARPGVWMSTLDSFGRRSGGSSYRNGLPSPGSRREAACPTMSTTSSTTPIQRPNAAGGWPESIAAMTPNCAEHGMPRANSNVVMIRSRRLSRMRVVMVAIVSQPSPSTRGRTALPFKPTNRQKRLAITASLGKYPTSSMKPKHRKNIVTIGRIIANA